MKRGQSLIEIIKSFLESDKIKLPVLDSTAIRIQKEISNKDPDVQFIEKLIVSDQALASEVLRVSNSPFFMGFTEVTTIRQAITRLGVNEIANIILLVSQESNFHSKDSFIQNIMQKLWQHSMGCALAGRWISKNAGLISLSHEVFLGALLHDVGKLVILKAIDEIKHSKDFNVPIVDNIINEAMNSLHTDIGYSLMIHWNLPEKYAEITRDHHLEEFNSINTLMVIIRLADKVCNGIGIGLCKESSSLLTASPEAQLMNMSEIDFAKLEVSLEDSKMLH